MKSALLCSLLLWTVTGFAKLVTSDRYLIKIVDRIVSFQDIEYQLRNLYALNCVYSDALVVQYFGPKFLKNIEIFIKDFPKNDEDLSKFLRNREDVLLQLRQFFKMLRYSEDQKSAVSPQVSKLIRESAKENRCGTSVLYKDTLKTNFIALMEMEIYLRTRYGQQIKPGGANFESVRPSIDLFVDSLDKQFAHEYYW